jgi:hypothetical protein
MSQIVTLRLSEQTYAQLQKEAEAAGTSPAEFAAIALEKQFTAGNGPASASPARSAAEKQAARERFERHFGGLDITGPTRTDNESLDADLAHEYGDTHEEA